MDYMDPDVYCHGPQNAIKLNHSHSLDWMGGVVSLTGLAHFCRVMS